MRLPRRLADWRTFKETAAFRFAVLPAAVRAVLLDLALAPDRAWREDWLGLPGVKGRAGDLPDPREVDGPADAYRAAAAWADEAAEAFCAAVAVHQKVRRRHGRGGPDPCLNRPTETPASEPPRLAEFNDAGVSAFAGLLARAADGLPAPNAAAEALALARDPQLTDAVRGGPPVDPDAPFETRAELADLTLGLLADAGVAAGPEAHRVGLWTWLAAVWLPRLCRSGRRRCRAGRRKVLKVGEVHRYVLSLEVGTRYYRHLVAGPAWLRHLHGDRARLFLSQRPCYSPRHRRAGRAGPPGPSTPGCRRSSG